LRLILGILDMALPITYLQAMKRRGLSPHGVMKGVWEHTLPPGLPGLRGCEPPRAGGDVTLILLALDDTHRQDRAAYRKSIESDWDGPATSPGFFPARAGGQ
jgi:hypothetical protein